MAMIGRREFGVLGLSAVGVAALEGFLPRQARAAQDRKDARHLEACAKACNDCQRECDSCATHCAEMMSHGHKGHEVTMATCLDCAEVCAAAARIVSRGGPFVALICEPCAEACVKCATECEKFPDDDRMKRCARECRNCEKACRDMLKQIQDA
jgi:hypothetical protein